MNDEAEVNFVRKQKARSRKDQTDKSYPKGQAQKHDCSRRQDNTSSCRNCGKSHAPRQCPAYGKKCFNCDKSNHFTKVCRAKKKIYAIEQDKTHMVKDEPLFIGAVNSNKTKQNKEGFKTLRIQQQEITFKIDTGSQANILPYSMFKKLKQVQLEKLTTKLTSYTGEYLPVVGQCHIKHNNKSLNFFVVETEQVPILGLKASQDLNLIKIIMRVTDCSKQETKTEEKANHLATDLTRKFPKVFQGLGCLEKSYHIKVDPKVVPVVNSLKSQPVALRERLKKSLDEMERDGVIEKVDEPTEWVNSVVLVEKPNSEKLCICLDPRPLNEAIQ